MSMKGYVGHIEELTEANADFRRVLYTGKNLQLVLMALKPGQDIGEETHATHDQFFRVEKGKGLIEIDGISQKVKAGDAIIVPAGALHNLINSSDKPLKVYTIYGPPNHLDHLEQKTKAIAEASSEYFDGSTSE